VLSVGLGVIAAVLSAVSYTRWRANEIAIRQGRPLPFSWVLPGLAGVCLLTSAVLVVLLIVT
jgi:putative membrane protein